MSGHHPPDDRLTFTELAEAAFAGMIRQVTNLRDGRRDAHGADPRNGWSLHIEGASGEMAVAKRLGVYWPGVGKLRAADVGAALQVRTTSDHHNCLIVHDDDRDEDTFVLVTGLAPRLSVRGWTTGREAKRAEFLSAEANREPAYFVPVEHLRPIEQLIDQLRGAVR